MRVKCNQSRHREVSLTTAYVMKHVDLRRTPSLELGMMFIFAYIPYGLAESLKLSGEQWM